MWPGLHVPTLARANGHSQDTRPQDAFSFKEADEQIDALLRISAGGKRDYILPAKCLDELPSGTSTGDLRDILEKHAIASIPGNGLNYIERCSGKLPVCLAGEGLGDMATRCRESGLQPEVLVSKDGSKFYDGRGADPFVSVQSLTVMEGEEGKKVPFLKPRTRLSAEDRTKMQLGPSRRSLVTKLPEAKASIIDDEAAAKSRADRAIDSILKQIDFIVEESLGFYGVADDLPPPASLAPTLQVLQLLPVPEPPELSLLHEELPASMASVVQEFPKGVVPAECRAAENTGMIRAKAVRIRGSPESAYPFIKGGAASLVEDQKQMMLADPSGIEE